MINQLLNKEDCQEEKEDDVILCSIGDALSIVILLIMLISSWLEDESPVPQRLDFCKNIEIEIGKQMYVKL